MSRRQHVVRTDDQGGIGAARSLGGSRVLCAREPCGDIYEGDQVEVAAISVTSSGNYQRCFVSATVGQIHASIPDPPPPPGPGSWSLRFEYNNPTGEQYYSAPYYSLDAGTTISNIRWGNTPAYEAILQFEGIEKYDGLWWQKWLNFVDTGLTSGVENPDPPVVLDSKIRMAISSLATEPCWVEFTLNSPTGEGTENVVISDG